jgi:putative nucleotidyltransferase with HDIG domain
VIPTRQQCLELIADYEMPPHILRHSKLVTKVALLIASRLNQVGQHLDLTLVEAGALLHDITKRISIETLENHATTGGELLSTLGYPEVADIIRQHVDLDLDVEASGRVVEAELVNYADKRVMHEEIVDLAERFRDIEERYADRIPGLRPRLRAGLNRMMAIERKIFGLINIQPEDVADILS